MISKIELKKELKKLGIYAEGGYVKKKDIKKIFASTPLLKKSFNEIKEEVKKQAIADGLKVVDVQPSTFIADKDSGVNAVASQIFEVYMDSETFEEYEVRAVVGNGFFLEIKKR